MPSPTGTRTATPRPPPRPPRRAPAASETAPAQRLDRPMQDGADVRLAQTQLARDRAIGHLRPVLERDQLALAIRQPREQQRQPLGIGAALRQLLGRGASGNLERLVERSLAPL